MSLELPFVGREAEVRQLTKLHAQKKHAFIIGPPGIGKSALIAHLRTLRPLFLCAQSSTLAQVCDGLERELGLASEDLRLVKRKNRVLKALADAGQAVVFDGVSWTTPKLSSFLDGASERVPVWIASRAEHGWDFGHFWPFLWKFARVELHPFHLAETEALVDAAVKAGLIPPQAMSIAAWLHQRSNGSPLVLRELFEELATSRYDVNNPRSLRLLDLDRRIHEVFPG